MAVKMYAEYLLDTAKKGEIKMNYDKTYDVTLKARKY